MNRDIAGIIVLALALLHPAPAGAEAGAVVINDRTQYYDVRGDSVRTLDAQLRALGPIASSGRRSWAFTAWEVRARYYLEPQGDGCRVTEPRAELDVVTTFPRWQTTAASPWRLRSRWEAMFASLQRHEQTHRAHAQQAAQVVAANLQALPMQPDCQAADRAAQRILRSAVAASRRLSHQYDQVTHFGAAEGVSLEMHESARQAPGFKKDR